jgi:RNA methyltransferase, TrmH family
MQTVSEEITSKENQYIKLAKSLHQKKDRNELNLFLIEGKNLLEEALKRGIEIQYVFYDNEETIKNLNPQLKSSSLSFLIDKDLLGKIATTETPPPIVAVAQKPTFANHSKTKTHQNSDIYLFCENVQDPGNLGSIIRTGLAAGVKAIYLSENCVDIYNSKVIRSSMGAIFCGDIQYINLNELIEKIKSKSQEENKNLEIIGTSSHAKTSYRDIQLNPFKNALVIVGNEAHGMSKQAEDLCSQLVSIPLENNIESLNVLSATSIILFSLNR